MENKPYILNGERVSRDEYNKTRFDRFLLTTPKGGKDKIKAHAQEQGMSLNAYIVGLIEKDMGPLETTEE